MLDMSGLELKDAAANDSSLATASFKGYLVVPLLVLSDNICLQIFFQSVLQLISLEENA